MIKLEKVMVQGVLPAEHGRNARQNAPSTGKAGSDRVEISEEGKRRFIMGHLMATISEQGEKKR